MIPKRAFWGFCLVAGLIGCIQPAAGENYPVIIRGKVVMTDGSPPPITVAVERVCSDEQGSAPGPLVNKKGEYLWRMDVDPMRTRSCVIRATHAGYTSTSVDISALNGYLSTTLFLEPIVLSSLTADPYAILISDAHMPPRGSRQLKAALKALNVRDYAEATRQFQAAMELAPKFAPGWHALGVLLERGDDTQQEAKQAYQHAIDADPKLLTSYVTLARLCVKTKDWEYAVKTADALIKLDNKHQYPEIHLHRAVALFGLKDLDRALASVQEAMRLDPNHLRPRAEYVYGRILEAKGDIAGAREHMTKYLELDKHAPDPNLIKQHMQNLGTAGTSAAEDPELEYL